MSRRVWPFDIVFHGTDSKHHCVLPDKEEQQSLGLTPDAIIQCKVCSRQWVLRDWRRKWVRW